MTTFKIIFLACRAIYFFALYAPRLRQIKHERARDNRSSGGELPARFACLARYANHAI